MYTPTPTPAGTAAVIVTPQTRTYLDCQAVRSVEPELVIMVQLALIGILIALVAIHALNFVGRGE